MTENLFTEGTVFKYYNTYYKVLRVYGNQVHYIRGSIKDDVFRGVGNADHTYIHTLMDIYRNNKKNLKFLKPHINWKNKFVPVGVKK